MKQLEHANNNRITCVILAWSRGGVVLGRGLGGAAGEGLGWGWFIGGVAGLAGMAILLLYHLLEENRAHLTILFCFSIM